MKEGYAQNIAKNIQTAAPMTCYALLDSNDHFAMPSSLRISWQYSTHSLQMNTLGPTITLRTFCWLLLQKEQQGVFLFPVLPLLSNATNPLTMNCTPLRTTGLKVDLD
jgi:hypothetical protein